MQIPKILLNRIAQRKCVVFVGAGYSMPCNMPNWHSLLTLLLEDARKTQSDPSRNEILNACDKFIDEGQHSLAARLLREVMTPSDFNGFIADKFSMGNFHTLNAIDQLRMKKRMMNLVAAPWAGIVTTNYDGLIDYAIGNYNKREVVQVYGDDPTLGTLFCSPSPNGFFYVKLHDSAIGGNFVIGSEEFDRTFINTPHINSFLITLMLRYHLVFIGCSLKDEVFSIRRKLNDNFKGRIPTSYALLPNTDKEILRKNWFRNQAQIHSLLYDIEENSEFSHFGVDLFLERAADCTDTATDNETYDITSDKLIKLPEKERFQNIGIINQDLIKFILSANEEKASVSHLQLIKPSLVQNIDEKLTILRISPEERVYRMLFLTSIGLIKSFKENDGSRYYKIPDKVLNGLTDIKRKLNVDRAYIKDELRN